VLKQFAFLLQHWQKLEIGPWYHWKLLTKKNTFGSLGKLSSNKGEDVMHKQEIENDEMLHIAVNGDTNGR